ncbi:MAG TPA: heme biosynthesis protein HemY, partial [Magnetovibrio sp.]
AEEARRQVGKADGLLGEPPLTLLLKAQAAQLNGDERAAESFFIAMLDDPEMEFLGLRGLFNQAMKRGDDKAALALAHRAQALNSKSVWVTEATFQLEARTGDWQKAGETLKRVGKLTDMTQGAQRHRRALTLLGQSVAAEKTGKADEALRLAQKAVSEDLSLIPAAAHLARLLLARGSLRKAKSVLEKTWSIQSHPDLMTLYFEACGAEEGLKKVGAAQKLLELNPSSADSQITMAVAALEAQLWGQARTHLQAALEAGRTTRTVYTLLARLEEEDAAGKGRGDREQAHMWLALAASAAADPAWVCDHCGHVDAHWAPHCPKCGGFDSFTWTTPSSAPALAVADVGVLKLPA